MSKLEGVGYVSVQKEFVDKIPRTLFRLTEKDRAAFHEYRVVMKQIFSDLPD